MGRTTSKSSDQHPPPSGVKRAAVADFDGPSFQREFFARMGGPQQFQQLFEHLPDAYFFVKDRQSRMVCGSQPFWEHLGASSEAEIIGKLDNDFFRRTPPTTFNATINW